MFRVLAIGFPIIESCSVFLLLDFSSSNPYRTTALGAPEFYGSENNSGMPVHAIFSQNPLSAYGESQRYAEGY